MTLSDMIELQEWPKVDEHHPGAKASVADRTCPMCEYVAPNKIQMAHHQRLWHK